MRVVNFSEFGRRRGCRGAALRVSEQEEEAASQGGFPEPCLVEEAEDRALDDVHRRTGPQMVLQGVLQFDSKAAACCLKNTNYLVVNK
jgi:hypothetical protein